MSIDYLIYNDKDEIKVRNVITNNEKTFDKVSVAIQFVLDNFDEDGGEITLTSGRHYLDKPVRLKNNVRLCGKGRSTKLEVSEENEESIGIICEEIEGVVISDLVVTAGTNSEARTGIILDSCGDCKVKGVFGVGFKEYGIWVRNNSFLCNISGCSFAGNQKANIYFDTQHRGRIGDFIPNLVQDCVIYGGGKGIECYKTTVINIIGCTVYQTRDIGFHIHGMSCSVLISGCRTFQIGKYAVYAKQAHELNISSNIFCWQIKEGIVIEDCGWGTINGNEIIDSGSYNAEVKDFTFKRVDIPEDVLLKTGLILSKTRGFNISGNTIFNWPQSRKMKNGIEEDKDCYDNNITGNNINYYDEEAIISKGRDTSISSNKIEKDSPHVGDPQQKFIQSFRSHLTDNFINKLK